MSIQQIKQKHLSRLNWTPEQQAHLKLLKEINGIISWTSIAKQLNKVFEGKNRSGKQCRERYMNYVKFSDQKQVSSRWTLEEDEILFKKFFLHGRKWVQISKQMPGKSQNCVKNRFYGAIRKMTRRINKIHKQKKIKQKKILKQDAYIRILQSLADRQQKQGCDQKSDDLIRLQNDLIRVALISQEDLIPEQVVDLGLKITQYISSMKTKIEVRHLDAQQIIEEKDATSSQNDKETLQKWTQQFEVNIYFPICPSSGGQNKDQSFYEHKSQEKKYLMTLGLDYTNYNCTVSQDLEKEVSQILNQQYIESSVFII